MKYIYTNKKLDKIVIYTRDRMPATYLHTRSVNIIAQDMSSIPIRDTM
jgi:hypothetical protein